MYGDTDVVRALARQVRVRGADIRAEADDLLGRVEAVAWTGLAAEAMRRLAREHADEMRACADAHEAAAEALERHAREVDHLVDLIAAVEHRVRHLLDGAAHGLSGLVGYVMPDAVDHWLHHFDPPPHGSREWLDVHVPRSA
jgi:molybdopterin/thiamine biosynthesis adenylyltransferase